MKTFAWAFVAFLWALWPPFGLCELIVNVSRNRTHPLDGIVRQVITGNSSTELVTVEYKEVKAKRYINQNCQTIFAFPKISVYFFYIFLVGWNNCNSFNGFPN